MKFERSVSGSAAALLSRQPADQLDEHRSDLGARQV
jgi:hypothetical protein